MVKILKAIKKCEQFHLLILFSQRGINYLWGRWKEQLEINMSWIFNIYIVIRFFSTVMYGCESWTIKKTEHRRIDAFKQWHWRRLLRVPWIASRSNQSIPKEISPEYALERLMLKLKLQDFGHLIQRTDSLEKILMWERLKAEGEGDDRGLDGLMASLTSWT